VCAEHGARLAVGCLRHLCTEATFEQDLVEDVTSECAKLGEVHKVTVYPASRDAVVVVRFKRPGAATLCIETMNGRWFGGQKIECELWDGVTDFAALYVCVSVMCARACVCVREREREREIERERGSVIAPGGH
jgi:hypothetical protein